MTMPLPGSYSPAGIPRQETPMNHHPGRWHPMERTTEQDLAILAAGGETGWWDEHGRPAPWPRDFLDPDAGWTPTGLDEPEDPQTSTENAPHGPPF